MICYLLRGQVLALLHVMHDYLLCNRRVRLPLFYDGGIRGTLGTSFTLITSDFTGLTLLLDIELGQI